MRLFLLDRDGVVVVNRRNNIKRPEDLALIEGAAEGIRRLNAAGITVAICTNQPEVARGAMTSGQLDAVHRHLIDRLQEQGAAIDRIFSCTSQLRCPMKKPAPGMLVQALRAYGASARETPYVGDQADDLKAAFHAGCPRILVRTGLGTETLDAGLPSWVAPVAIHDNLAEAVVHYLAGRVVRAREEAAQ